MPATRPPRLPASHSSFHTASAFRVPRLAAVAGVPTLAGIAASRSLSATRFSLYSDLALTPAWFFQDRDSCADTMPLAPTHAEISAVRFSLLLRCLDVTLNIEPRFPGASPGFHPREGGKAVRLRVQARFGHQQGFSSPSASPLRGLQQLHQLHPVTGALPG